MARSARVLFTVLLLAFMVVSCAEDSGGMPTLTWYTNPDNGGQADLAAKCTDAAGGRYRIEPTNLPTDANSQREQLVRRLAAEDRSIDIMSLDVVFVPEFAQAGFLRPLAPAEAAELTGGVLDGPRQTVEWNGQTVAAPFWANTQLLWYRKSVADRADLDPSSEPVSWDTIIDAAGQTDTTVQVTAGRYEGYMVWINALVASAGGAILEDPEAGRDATPGLDSDAGREAARIIRAVATSEVADPQLATATEETARAGFQAANGGFMVNWPYVYGAAQAAVHDGSLDQAVFDDIAWARYPLVEHGSESRPPLGGINLGIGAFSRHADLAVDAVACLSSLESQVSYMLAEGNPGARGAVFDNPDVRAAFPMSDLIRDSIDAAGSRPRTAYYPDVSAATIRVFHPPTDVDPERTPSAASDFIVDVLHDRRLV